MASDTHLCLMARALLQNAAQREITMRQFGFFNRENPPTRMREWAMLMQNAWGVWFENRVKWHRKPSGDLPPVTSRKIEAAEGQLATGSSLFWIVWQYSNRSKRYLRCKIVNTRIANRKISSHLIWDDASDAFRQFFVGLDELTFALPEHRLAPFNAKQALIQMF